MENLYKLNEYSSELPNPKSFPIKGSSISSIKDMPYTFTDGFFIDLSVREQDRVKLKRASVKEFMKSSINDILIQAKQSDLLLSEPEFVYETNYIGYVVFTPEGNPRIVQVKYYNYFRNRYKNCKFYIRYEWDSLIAVKVNKEVVGICMLMFYSKEILGKIREERK